MKVILYKFIFFRLMKWKIIGEIKEETKKCILLVAPHTSWHDFYIGVFCRGIIQKSMNFVSKKALSILPFGYYFRWMGGALRIRVKTESEEEAIDKIFKQKEEFRLAIAPEGT